MEPATGERPDPLIFAASRGLRWRASFSMLLLLLCAAGRFAAAAEPCAPQVAQVVSMQGVVEIQRVGQAGWVRAERLDARLCQGDRLRAGVRSRAALLVGPQALIRVDQNTTIELHVTPDETRVAFDSGAVYSISRTSRRYRVITPYMNAGVEGTEFLVTLGSNYADLAVYEGRVAVEDLAGAGGALSLLHDGQAARFARGAPPVARVLSSPSDAVQWALYYPPLDSGALEGFADCERLTVGQRAVCLAGRASALLRLGRVDEAHRDIAAAESVAPPNAETLALAAIIRLAKNDKIESLALAKRAVSQDRNSPRALLALSYALQAAFKLEAALMAARSAAELQPADSVAQARRAELLLAMGRIRDAEAAALTAVQVDPVDSRARTVLAFARLARFDAAGARDHFNQALVLDPSDPLPRLGLGLAAIRQGKLEEGRREIEIAVALDPQSSLLRSYLGKAYADESRDALAGRQLEWAMLLDPRDPTPWFYDAIRLQALNRPGEALVELHESIERNENRAVYRSRLLLDQDQAARSASRARIHSDLGFDELAVSEARNALMDDPASFGAHRFLADAYLPMPGFEIARTSELLQSQLLQPVNAAPLSPRLQQIRSPVLPGSGPVTPSFQEFNPLFARDRHAMSLSGTAGSAQTWSDEIVYGAYREQRSFQLGQYHHETDGLRVNADLRQDFYRAFYQEDLGPQTSFQAELSHGETRAGDTRFQFEPGSFAPLQRGRLEVSAVRLGARHSWIPGSMVIASLIAQRRDTRFADSVVDPFFRVDFDDASKIHSYTGELQYQKRGSLGDLIAGGGLFGQDETGLSSSTLDLFGPPPMVMTTPIDSTLRTANAYVYSQLGQPSRARLMMGLSVDHVENRDATGLREDTKVNPKLGSVLPLGSGTSLRFAAFRGMKRLPAVNASIEPTQVAGFNQTFDDLNRTRFWRYGAALDRVWDKRLFAGLELTRRELSVPDAVIAGVDEDRTEWLHRAYWSWLATPRVAAGIELLVEQLERKTTPPGGPFFVPAEIDTRSLPLTLSYHTPAGFFARSRVSFVHQEIRSRNDFGAEQRQRERFSIVDLSMGMRLPGRIGMASLEVRNVLDESFVYRDTAFEGLPRVPLYAPERTVFVRMQLGM
jgi:tetratricopeptide (TPR) repeat protein